MSFLKAIFDINWFGVPPEKRNAQISPNECLRKFVENLDIAKNKTKYSFTTDLNSELCLDDISFLIEHFLGQKSYSFKVQKKSSGCCLVSIKRDFSMNTEKIGPFPSQ